jgi:F-type H+-transporting ATPase subunit b
MLRRTSRAKTTGAGWLAAAALAPVVTVAAEAAGEGGWSPFQGDVGNALWTLVVFVILLWVLGRWAWGPILAGLQGREDFIRSSLEQAKGERDQARVLLGEYEGKLASAREEIEAMIDEARRDAASLREREEAAAKAEARQIIDRARREIQIATDTAVAELYERATGLATLAAGKVLERELTGADHQRLIAESIRAVESAAPGAAPRGAGDTGPGGSAH